MAGAEPADGAWLRRLRTSAGLTQAQLAAQASVGIRTVRDLERGEARPRASSLNRLATALGIDVEQLDKLAHGGDGDRVRGPAAEEPEGRHATQQVRVDVLGPLTVRRGPGTVISISSTMQRTLLSLLAVQPDQVAGVEEIIDTLWGSVPPRTCRELVHTYVSSLRRLLAAPASPTPLRREQTGYRLRLGPDESDAARFADLAARARRAATAGAAQSAWQLYGEALACWRGPLLAGEGAWRAQHPAAVALAALRVALAVRWARAARERFPDGQLYADLRGHGVGGPARPLEVLAGFLRAFGVAPDRVPAEEDQASALLRSLMDRKRVLVLLDNAADAEQVRPLLPASPGCAALVTSRGRLGGLVARDGAWLLAVGPLTAAESAELLARAIGAARAQAERAAVAEIADLCAHLPLALRITAANLATRPTHHVGDHVARLTAGARLDALAVEGDPQTAVRATFDLSCAALEPADLRVFRLSGLAPGPDVTAAQSAALAALTVAEASAALNRLADRNLLFEHTPGRFKAHDLVRLYALELACATESTSARVAAVDRLTAYFLAGTSRAAQLLYPHLLAVPDPDADETPPGAGPTLVDGRAALAWLDAERLSLVALTAQLADTGAAHSALVLAGRLNGYFFLRADRVHWPTIARIALQAAAMHGEEVWLAMAWLQCGMATKAAADYDASSGHFIRSANAARRAGWPAGEAVAFNNLATSLWALGRVDEAVERFGEALVLHRLGGRAAGEAVTLANLAAARIEQAREADDARGTLLEEALHLIDLARELHRGIGDRRNDAMTVRLQAEVHRELGDDVRALDLAREALRMAVDSGDLLSESSAHSTLATLLARTREPGRAFAEHERALDIARAVDAARETAEALMDLAETHASLGQPDDAMLVAGDAQAMAARANSVVLRRRTDRVRARLSGAQAVV